MINVHLTYQKASDVSNRREACNRKTQSSTWKKAMTDEIYNAVHGKERKDASSIILQHIDENHGTVDMKKYERQLSLALEKNRDIYIKKLEALTKHPFPYNDITCYITTLARCPYNRKKGLIWLWYKAEDPIRVFLHEILHFQFHQRYRNHPKVKLLSQDQFEHLKESLTFLLNIEFKEFIEFPDYGYPQHQELRKRLEDYWLSQPEHERDFEKLIDYGCTLFSQSNTMQEKILGTMINEEFADRILDVKNYRKTSVRGVISDKEGKIAIIYSPKEAYYKLPGGGVETGESDDVALQREGSEEAGVKLEVLTYIGTIVEQNKSGDVLQNNRGYTAKVVGEKGVNALTHEERERKFELHRMDIDEAIALMTKNSPISYRGRFMQTRDLTFLQEAKKLISS